MTKTTTTKSKTVEISSKAKGAGSSERTISDRAGEQRDSDNGNTVEDTGVVISTPNAEDDAKSVVAVMDAISDLFTDEEERTSQTSGEVYVANKREYPRKMMLRQFIRQLDFDMTNLKGTIAKNESTLARMHRQVNADPRQLKSSEARIEALYDAFAERGAMRREAVAYYPELTGEFFETPGGPKSDPAPASTQSDWERRQAARMALING